MTITILPNAKTQFFSAAGVPLAGGSVYMYVPSTTTFSTTWQDSGATIPNTNPIILDGAGECLLWGTGRYRQVVYDASNNLIWDQITEDPGYAIMATFNGTSTTSNAIGTGSKSFTTQTGLQFFPGGTVNIASNASALNYMNGTVTSYNTSTGALVVNVLTDGGSGTHSDWNIAVSGIQGPAGTVTSISVASANGFAGSSSGGGTPILTLSTGVTGVLKGNGTAIIAATASVDYIAPNTGSAIVNESMLNISNNNTANVTTSAHGFAPILPGNVSLFLNGNGGYTAPGVSALVGTSTSSNTIGLGTVTFTTQSGLTLGAGQFVIIPYSGNSADYFFGSITSYTGTTLVVNATVVGGSGTFASWNIFISGPQGPQGSGTINSGTMGQIGYYANIGSTISGANVSTGLTLSGGNLTLNAATSSALGGVIPDGTIITVSSGAITVAKASAAGFGVAKVDNSTIISSAGLISAATSTSGSLGVVKVDGTTITINGSGVISSSAIVTAGGIGSYVLASQTTGTISAGGTIAGSSLTPYQFTFSGASSGYSSTGYTVSGTYAATATANSGAGNIQLWQRIA
jgi:hypothetical protein